MFTHDQSDPKTAIAIAIASAKSLSIIGDRWPGAMTLRLDKKNVNEKKSELLEDVWSNNQEKKASKEPLKIERQEYHAMHPKIPASKFASNNINSGLRCPVQDNCATSNLPSWTGFFKWKTKWTITEILSQKLSCDGFGNPAFTRKK